MWEWVRWNATRSRQTTAGGPRVSRQRDLFGAAAAAPSATQPPPESDYDAATVLRHEADTLGFLISRHPLTLYRRELASLNHVSGADLHRHVGRRVRTIGWLVTGKVVGTKSGEAMEFLSFEDTSAIYETTMFPVAYRKFCHMLSRARPFVLTGKVEEDFGAITLTVTDLQYLERSGATAVARPSPPAGRPSAETSGRRDPARRGRR